jgi:hypothetical protein
MTLTVEDTQDSARSVVYRTIFGLDGSGIQSPLSSPTIWCIAAVECLERAQALLARWEIVGMNSRHIENWPAQRRLVRLR